MINIHRHTGRRVVYLSSDLLLETLWDCISWACEWKIGIGNLNASRG